jgi:hypothetical protein
MEEYEKLMIFKFTGLNIKQYLDLTTYERERIIKKASSMVDALNKETNELNEEIASKSRVDMSDFNFDNMLGY